MGSRAEESAAEAPARIPSVVDRPSPKRAVRKSLIGQDRRNPHDAETLARAVRSGESRVEATADAIPNDNAPSFQLSAALRAYLEANPPGPANTYGRTRADRYRTPGWSDLAEIHYLAQQASRRKRPRGRPKGPYLIQSREEIESVYRTVWTETGRRPYWSDVARRMGVDERTLRDARHAFSVNVRTIHKPDE